MLTFIPNYFIITMYRKFSCCFKLFKDGWRTILAFRSAWWNCKALSLSVSIYLSVYLKFLRIHHKISSIFLSKYVSAQYSTVKQGLKKIIHIHMNKTMFIYTWTKRCRIFLFSFKKLGIKYNVNLLYIRSNGEISVTFCVHNRLSSFNVYWKQKN